MRPTAAHELCIETKDAIRSVRLTFSGNLDMSVTLDGFWRLQDSVGRLLEAANDYRTETFSVLEFRHRGIVENIFNVLDSADHLGYANNPAVKESCEAINQSLVALEYLQQSVRAGQNGVNPISPSAST